MICGLIGHKKYSCPAPPQPLPQEKYAISLKAITVSRPRLLLSPSVNESASVLSSDSPASSHSTAPLEIFHGTESHKLQFTRADGPSGRQQLKLRSSGSQPCSTSVNCLLDGCLSLRSCRSVQIPSTNLSLSQSLYDLPLSLCFG